MVATRPKAATGRLAAFIGAANAYRATLATEAKVKGFVRTLTGRMIPLPADEDNHGGKAVNRVIQGTAADIFNRAAVGVASALDARRLGDIAFLLFDELWCECDSDDVATVAELIEAEMMTAALALGVFVPVRMNPPPDRPAPFAWEQLARWRWGPAVDDPESGIVVPNLTREEQPCDT